MRASDNARLCQEAQIYYYDLVCPEEGAVPASVRRHAAACPVCREQIRRLREVLCQSQESPRRAGSGRDETIEALTEQFRLLETHVTCADAKPYLPELAAAAPAIRIPTPVTVHVDQCPACAEDLRTVRKLNLTAEQLKRLGRVLKSYRAGGVLPLNPGRIRLERCGDDAHDGRIALPAETPVPPETGAAPVPFADGPVACGEVSAAEIFDYVVGPDAVRDELPAVTAHLGICPVCRAGALSLQRTIEGIAARENAPVRTVYHAGDDLREASEQRSDLYRYPVSVDVLHGISGSCADRSDAPAAGTACSPASEYSPDSLAAPQSGRFRRETLVRAAVIGVAVVSFITLLRTTAPTASGTFDNEVLKALAQVKNVHILTTAHTGRLAHEFYIARGSNRFVRKTTQECVLYDLGNDRKETIELRTGIRAVGRLNKDERRWVRQIMVSCLARELERISPDTRLEPSAAPPEAGGKDLDVHEVRGSQRGANAAAHDRWWIYIDRITGLPHKTEFYRRPPRASRWDLQMTTVFAYPTEQEMRDTIQALFPAQ